jgi:hypothetical protein
MCLLWKTNELDIFVQELLMDTRDGTRQGLPPEAAEELLFVARINLMVRAMDLAPTLHLDIQETCNRIIAADRQAKGTPGAIADPWGEHLLPPERALIFLPEPSPETDIPKRPSGYKTTRQWLPGERARSGKHVAVAERPAPEVSSHRLSAYPEEANVARSPARTAKLAAEHRVQPAEPRQGVVDRPALKSMGHAELASGPASGRTDHFLSLFLNETPPIPASVRIDLSHPIPATPSVMPKSDVPELSHEFFRCIARELKSLGVDEIVLSHVGEARKCGWVAEAVLFAKRQCDFRQVSLRVDPLTASDSQVASAIAAGLDNLIIECNLLCHGWQGRAAMELDKSPNHLVHRVQRFLATRDENSSAEGRCVIRLEQIGHARGNTLLATQIQRLVELVDMPSLEKLPGSDRPTKEDAGTGIRCVCWGPFTEAYINADGHLMACRHDRLGTTFVADLKAREFALAWHSESLRATRLELLNGRTQGTLCAACPGRFQ